MEEPAFNPWRELRAGIATIFADRLWPAKIAVGGGLMISLLGVIFPQGFVIEHLDNSQRGFRVPLPAWRQWSDKAVMGLLATVLDFVYFGLPLLLTLILMLCAVLPLLFRGDDQSGWASWLIIGVLGLIALASFLLSLSPLAKVRFAKQGDIENNLGRPVLRRALNPLTRGLYWRARVASLPLYLPALAAAAGLLALIQGSGTPGWMVILAAWALSCTLFWAWLITAQIYQAANGIAEDREIEARLAARKEAINRE